MFITTDPSQRHQTLASCLINAQTLPAHRPAADNSSLNGCTWQIIGR